jgi:hypothetical protein
MRGPSCLPLLSQREDVVSPFGAGETIARVAGFAGLSEIASLAPPGRIDDVCFGRFQGAASDRTASGVIDRSLRLGDALLTLNDDALRQRYTVA